MSFKIVRGASEYKYLSTSSFPTSGTGTTTDFTWFGWMKVVTASKWSRLLAHWTDDSGAPIDFAWMGRESNGTMRGGIDAYPPGGVSFASGSISSNTWIAYTMRSQLGTGGKMIATGVSEQTGSNSDSAWNGASGTMFRNLRIGATYNGTDEASMTVLFAHICIWKARLSDDDVSSLQGGANPLAISASNILEYWSGASLTGYNSTVLSETGSGTFTADDSDNPTVDDPPGGASAVPLLMQMYHGG